MLFCILPSSYKNSLKELSVVNSSDVNNDVSYGINRTLIVYTGRIKSRIESGSEIKNLIENVNPYFYLYTPLPNAGHSVCSITNSYSFFVMIEVLKNIPNAHINENNKILNCFHLTDNDYGSVEAVKYVYKDVIDKCVILNNINNNINNNNINNNINNNNTNNNNTNNNNTNNNNTNANVYDKDVLFLIKDTYTETFDLITSCIDTNSNYIELLYQIAYAINLQRQGGTFIFKIEETYSNNSLGLLFLLSNIYKQVGLIKPYSSNICYDEIYVVCSGFNKPENNIYDAIINILDNPTCIIDVGIAMPCLFTNKIEHYNSMVGQQRLYSLLCITNYESSIILTQNENVNKNIKKCITWCKRYNLPLSNHFTNNSTIIAYNSI